MPRRVDCNQGVIVDGLRAVGAEWVPTSGDPGIGFDGIVAFRGVVHLAEIKDGSQPPSKRRLTANEQRRAAQLARVGVTVHVLECLDDGLKMLGMVE